MKKISASILALCLLTSVFSSVLAAEKPLSVWQNGEQIQFRQTEPIIEKGVMLVPVRPLLQKLGVEIKWDQAAGTVSGAKEGPL
ncbi:stalk domain-containing protein [Paenibacillus sp. JCM 10914]|uniref:stalk domain-containing protein n=1 Tax=Paenibacillus sp. JCM 10914 TaxID=1236974 RepID=UPI00130DA0A4|nr:stalk domain-containing protein [Paenibacillus sp. JCM 10914]